MGCVCVLDPHGHLGTKTRGRAKKNERQRAGRAREEREKRRERRESSKKKIEK